MICPICGKLFTPTHGNQKYCSTTCRLKKKKVLDKNYYIQKQRKKPEVKCEYCNKLFTPTHGNQKYCSASCQYNAELEQNADSRMKSYHKNKKRGGDKFWGLGSGGLGSHMHDDPELELIKIHNEMKRLGL